MELQGAGTRFFPRLIHDLRNKYNGQVLIIIEPRISGQIADKVVSKLGFCNSFRSEDVGFSRGIWLLWENQHVNIDSIRATDQLIHCRVSLGNGKEDFYLTCVYGIPIPTVRLNLWPQIEEIHREVDNYNWVCIGDFNAYRTTEDKQGVPILILKL